MAGSKGEVDQVELKAFLEEKASQYNNLSFIATDPIQVPHRYADRTDIEIAGFLTATIAWGRKASIIANARKLLDMMPGGPAEFISGTGDREYGHFLTFVHRTFNGIDCIFFLESLRRLYLDHGGPGQIFREAYEQTGDMGQSIARFRELFFRHRDPGRSAKHLPDVSRNSAAKRINMFLRWMVRRDNQGVDFGLWDQIPMHALYVPLDVHSGTVARKLGLLERKQNDWKAVLELTNRLRAFDPTDPVRYDYALFGLGSFEGF